METDNKFKKIPTGFKVVGVLLEMGILAACSNVDAKPTIATTPDSSGNGNTEPKPTQINLPPTTIPEFTPTPFFDFKLMDQTEIVAGLPGPFDKFKNDEKVKNLFENPESVKYTAWGIKDLNVDGTAVNYTFFRATSKEEGKDYTAMVFGGANGKVSYAVLNPAICEDGNECLALTINPETGEQLPEPRMVFNSGLTRDQIDSMSEEEYESGEIYFVYPGSVIKVPADRLNISMGISSQNESPAAYDETDIAQSNRIEFTGKYMGLETNVAFYLSSSLSPNLTTLSIKDQSSALEFNFDTQFKRWSTSHPGETQQDYLDLLNNYQDGDDIPLTDIGFVIHMNDIQDGLPYEEGQEPYLVVPVQLHEDAPQEIDGMRVVGTNNFEYAVADDTNNVTTIDSSGTGYGINYDPVTNKITFVYCPPNGGNFAVKANASINIIRGLARWSWFMGRNTGSPFTTDQYPSASGELESDLKKAGLTVN